MNIAVLGTGTVGQALAGRLHDLGHSVTVGTRDPRATLARAEPDGMGNPPYAGWQGEHAGIDLRTFAEAAAAAGPAPRDQLVGLFDALSSSCRREGYRGCAFLNAAAESVPGSPVHERTVAHKQAVLGWVEGLATEAGAEQPKALARSLTLLLDGGLASGALDADPAAARVAQQSAAALVDAWVR
jgi:hypothetical protein